MRRFGKIDANQNEIVKQLRDKNISVGILSSVGNGFPDLVIGYKGKNYLIELKDGEKCESQKRLTILEALFFKSWRGQISKCENLISILEVIGYEKDA